MGTFTFSVDTVTPSKLLVLFRGLTVSSSGVSFKLVLSEDVVSIFVLLLEFFLLELVLH